MILYCDTSALIKRYVEEEGTGRVDALWSRADGVATSVVAFAETMAAFGRKRREGLLTRKEHAETTKKFKEDYRHLILVPIHGELNEVIEGLLKRHPLKGFDAIHLSSALLFAQGHEQGLFFACFDDPLSQAAVKEGLAVAC